ncbi:hypothetical protein NDU88_004930 [Pleurodeles waltl]|uniref:Uncharacterized protein n=1 Tax=Pleurodeles waltl TaxID=8319 RepID=A0AAV7T975_PLEWA|nr:hypothetical protein NDU88_004930 [Pleurodeles waltl]
MQFRPGCTRQRRKPQDLRRGGVDQNSIPFTWLRCRVAQDCGWRHRPVHRPPEDQASAQGDGRAKSPSEEPQITPTDERRRRAAGKVSAGGRARSVIPVQPTKT